MSSHDQNAIESVVRDYYDGMVHGREDLLRRAFVNDAHFQGVRDDQIVKRNLDAFVAMLANPEPWMVEDYDYRVELVDCSGPIAVVKVIDRFRGRTYTDYLCLLHHEDGWQIVNKLFWAWSDPATDAR